MTKEKIKEEVQKIKSALDFQEDLHTLHMILRHYEEKIRNLRDKEIIENNLAK